MTTADSKSKLAQLAIPLLTKLPDSVFRQMMETRLISLLGIEKEGLQKLLPAPQKVTKKQTSHKITPMRLAISILLQNPQMAYQVQEDKYEEVFFDILDNFLRLHLTQRIEFLKQKSRQGEVLTAKETLQLAQLLKEQKQH